MKKHISLWLFMFYSLIILPAASFATVTHTVRSGFDINWYFHTDLTSSYPRMGSFNGYWKDFNSDGLPDYLLTVRKTDNRDYRIFSINASPTGAAKTYAADKLASRDMNSTANTFVIDSIRVVPYTDASADGELYVVGTDSPDVTDPDYSYTKLIFKKLNKNNTSLPTIDAATFEILVNDDYAPHWQWLSWSYNGDNFPDIIVYNKRLNASNKFVVTIYDGTNGTQIWSKEFAKDVNDPGTGALSGTIGVPLFSVYYMGEGSFGSVPSDYDGDGVPEFLPVYTYSKDGETPGLYSTFSNYTILCSDGDLWTGYTGWVGIGEILNTPLGYYPSFVGDFNKDTYQDVVFRLSMSADPSAPYFKGYDVKNKTLLFNSTNSDFVSPSNIMNLSYMPTLDDSYIHTDVNGDTWNDMAIFHLAPAIGDPSFGVFNGYDGNGADKGEKMWFQSTSSYNQIWYPVGDFNGDGLSDYGFLNNPESPNTVQNGKITWKVGHCHIGPSTYTMGREFDYHVPYSFTYDDGTDDFLAISYGHSFAGDIDGDGSDDYMLNCYYNHDAGDDGVTDHTATEILFYDHDSGSGTPPVTAEIEIASDEDIQGAGAFMTAYRMDTDDYVDNNQDGKANDGIIASSDRFVYSVSFNANVTPPPKPSTISPILLLLLEGE
jgi:hypothetical protein